MTDEDRARLMIRQFAQYFMGWSLLEHHRYAGIEKTIMEHLAAVRDDERKQAEKGDSKK